MYSFPKNFMIGYSASGFQFEGGLPGGENPNSDWWVWVHDPENIASGLVSGDFPEDGPGYWHLYRTDHDIAERLGINTIRLGIEWSRVFPEPTLGVRATVDRDEDGNIVSVDIDQGDLEKLDKLANRSAVEHYIAIFNDWIDRGGKLILNLYHWPMPLWLHNPIAVRRRGPDRAPAGWIDDQAVVEFAKYAAYIAWRLGDLPDMWSTMNEPNAVYLLGYIYIRSGFPPGYLSMEHSLKAAKNLVQAHARGYDAIKRFSRRPVGIIYVYSWPEIINDRYRDKLNEYRETIYHAFIDSIKFGRSSIVGERSDLKDRLDWLGVNYYTRAVLEFSRDVPRQVPGYGHVCGENKYSLAGRPCSDFGWEIYPEGLYMVIKDLWKRYGIKMILTENGISDRHDRYRPSFIVSHLYMLYRAMKENIDIEGYLHWSLTDNYEWAQGFKQRFGLVEVDYESKKRRLRPSALIYREIASSNGIPEELEHLIQIHTTPNRLEAG